MLNGEYISWQRDLLVVVVRVESVRVAGVVEARPEPGLLLYGLLPESLM